MQPLLHADTVTPASCDATGCLTREELEYANSVRDIRSDAVIALRVIDHTDPTNPTESEHYLVNPHCLPEHSTAARCYLSDGKSDPKSFKDAMSRPDKKQWMQAFQDELCNLKDSWCFCDRSEVPPSAKLVPCLCVWTKKLNADGTVDRYSYKRSVNKGSSY